MTNEKLMTNAELGEWLENDIRGYLVGIGHWFPEDAAALAQLLGMLKEPDDAERKEMLKMVDAEIDKCFGGSRIITNFDVMEGRRWRAVRALILAPPAPRPVVRYQDVIRWTEGTLGPEELAYYFQSIGIIVEESPRASEGEKK